MKLVLLTALCALSFQASAQNVYGVGVGYEHDSATSNRAGLQSVAKSSLLVGARTKYGQFDAGVFEVTVRGERFFDTQQGAEVGYGNGFKVGDVALSGRIGRGKVVGRGLGAPSDTGMYSTYTLSAGMPITKQLGVGISARLRPEGDFDQQKQYGVGVTYQATKHVQLLGGFRHTRSTGPILNGVSASVRYFF